MHFLKNSVISSGINHCTECDTDLYKKFNGILKVHTDNEIQNTRKIIIDK